MADELKEKKPKPIGTPAPAQNQSPKPAPKQQLAPKNNSKAKELKGNKIRPGSPFKSESVPVGVQQAPLESFKHAEKRVNKMFKDTNQPTLGIWNKDKNNNPIAPPDHIRFNPNFNHKPTKEALEAARRKKIMEAGFGPTPRQRLDAHNNLLGRVSQKYPSGNAGTKANFMYDNYQEGDYDQPNNAFGIHTNGKGPRRSNWIEQNPDGSYKYSYREGTHDGKEVVRDDLSDDDVMSIFDEINTGIQEDDNGEKFDQTMHEISVKNDKALAKELEEKNNKTAPNPFKQNSMPGFEGMDNLWDNMSKSGQKVIDNNKQKESEAQQTANDPADEPGSVVVTPKLVNWVRNYLEKEVGKEYADTIADNLHKDHKVADFYRKLMKKEGGK